MNLGKEFSLFFEKSGKLHFADFFHLRKGLYGDFVWVIGHLMSNHYHLI